jgi:hypothetical protein
MGQSSLIKANQGSRVSLPWFKGRRDKPVGDLGFSSIGIFSPSFFPPYSNEHSK